MSHFFLNLFIASILIVPENSIVKVITFTLCMITNIKKLRFSLERFSLVIVFFIILLFGILTVYFRGINYDNNSIIMYLFNFCILSIFLIDPNKINIISGLNIAFVFIICSTFIYIFLVSSFPVLEPILLTVFDDVFMGLPKERGFLFWGRTTAFHLASPILVFPLALTWYKYLINKGIKNILYSFLLFLCLVFSGTRANSFSAILIVFIIYLHYIFYIKKRLLQTIFYATVAGSLVLIGTYLLLINIDASITVKAGHLYSYNELFNNDISYLLFGQGVGAYFFTTGFNRAVTLTELSYLELIRLFGLFSAVVIMLFYMLPLLKYNRFNSPFIFALGISYISYLFIAGTNPLLIGRTGFIALWLAYTLPKIKNNKYFILK